MRFLCLDTGTNDALMLQRVMEQRVDNVVANILPRLSLTNPRPMEDGGFQEVIYSLILFSCFG